MQNLTIFRLWVAAAWADGEVHPAEEKALRRFLDRATELDPADRAAATAMITTKPEIVLADEVAKLSDGVKADVYRAIVAIVRLDGKVTDEERVFIVRLREQLALPLAVIARIEQETA